MRLSVLALLFVVVPFAAYPALGASYVQLSDPVGDEAITFVQTDWVSSSWTRCRAPAIDITSVAATSDAGNLTVELSVADLASARYRCTLFGGDGVASYRVDFVGCPEDIVAECTHYASLNARSTGFGLEGCAQVETSAGDASDCLGSFAVSGDTLVWTLPLAGTVPVLTCDALDCVPETREYDFRGSTADMSASTRLAVAAAPFVDIRDYSGRTNMTF